MSGSPTTSSHAHSYYRIPEEMNDRKTKKPLMEKMRRQRINDSLNALKDFLLQFSPHDRTAKLEKADILERAVVCVRQLQAQQGIPQSVINSQEVYEKGRKEGFEEGFSQASRAVFNYLAMAMPQQNDPSAQQFHLGLVSHLRGFMMVSPGSLQFPSPVPPKSSPKWAPLTPTSSEATTSPSPTSDIGDHSDGEVSPLVHRPQPRRAAKRVWQPYL